MNARTPFEIAATQFVKEDPPPSHLAKPKCRVCRSMLRAEEGDDLVVQVCAFCTTTPDGRRLHKVAESNGVAAGAGGQTAREFTPAEKSLIQRMHRFTSASELLGILNERLSFDLGAAAVPYRLEQVSREISQLTVPAPVSGRDWVGTVAEIRRYIANGTLLSKVGTDGAQRGVIFVGKNQCAQLREKLGFTEAEAATRVGVTIPRFRVLLEGVNWRKADGIPLVTVQAVIKRLQSREGYTIEEAAEKLEKTTQWVHEQIQLGTIRVQKAKWDRRRIYISEPMLKRLEEAKIAKAKPSRPEELGEDWIILGEAAILSGVSMTTMIGWAKEGSLKRKQSTTGWRYHREGVKARARTYWETARFRRPIQPEWLKVRHSRSAKADRSRFH